MNNTLPTQGAMLQKEVVELLAQPPAKESRSPDPEARPVVSKKNRVQITSSAKRQKEAALSRPPYKGSQVPKEVLSRADALKRAQKLKTLQRVRYSDVNRHRLTQIT